MTSPPDIKTTVLLASLGKSKLSCMFRIEVLVQLWVVGGKVYATGFSHGVFRVSTT